MHTQQLTANTQDRPHEVERGEEAAIVGEIAVRLIELKELTSTSRVTTLISKLHAISLIDREALWIVLPVLTGDLSNLTKSYQEMAKARELDKQAIQQQVERALAALKIHFPSIAAAYVDLRHITASIPNPNDPRKET